jgi:predicted ester cyclase
MYQPDSCYREKISFTSPQVSGRHPLLSSISLRHVLTKTIKIMETNKNKEVILEWLTGFWGPKFDPTVIDKLAAPDMVLRYSLHKPRKGPADIKDFITKFRAAFPDLAFDGEYPLLADGEYVIARWIGGGTHTGASFNDWPVGSLPAATGKKMRFTGTTVFRVVDGKVKEEIGLDDGLTALMQLQLVKEA